MANLTVDRNAAVLIEAETTTGTGWSTVADANASAGAAMQASTSGAVAHLDLTLNFAAAGTYYLHLRGAQEGQLSQQDTLAVTFDGAALAPNAGQAPLYDFGYQWNGAGTLDAPLRIEVATPGDHHLSVTAGEAGLRLDALAITTDPATRPGAHQARSTADFIDSIGVNTHLGWLGTAYDHFETALDYLGVRHVRDGFHTAANLSRIDLLGAKGIKFDAIVVGSDPGATLEAQKQAISARADIVDAVEGPNETDLWPVWYGDQTGMAATRAMMADIYDWVHSDPKLNGNGHTTPVYQTTLADPARYGELSDLAVYADYANTHTYLLNGDAPGLEGIDRGAELAQAATHAAPVVATEAGYFTLPGDHGWGRWQGITEEVQGKLEPRLLLESFARGVDRTYLYELLDYAAAPQPDRIDFHFGLFRADGTPKPAATAIHNLISLLDEPAHGSFTPGTLDYWLTGMPGTAQDLLLQKANGTFELVLWNDADNWNETTMTGLSVPDAQVTLALGHAARAVRVYDASQGTTPIANYTGASTLKLSIPDHPIIVEIDPGSSAPLALDLGSGPDTLVLHLSEDAYLGDAQYTLKVNGQQIGGTLTAATSRASGGHDVVTLHGNWGAGPFPLEVTFLNDAYAGTADTDRNLFVDAITYNDNALPDGYRSLYSAGTASFTVSGAGKGGTTDTGHSSSAPLAFDLGSGPDALVLKISQDAYLGNAQYTISIDGHQIGGTLTASALHASGQDDTITIHGDFGAGGHTITLNFLNDAWAGTAATDRNLYVDGITCNGEAVANSTATLYSAGPHDFAFV